MVINSNAPLRPTAPASPVQPSTNVTEPKNTNTASPVQPTTRPPQGGTAPAGLPSEQILAEVDQALRTGANNLQGPEVDKRLGELEAALPQLGGGTQEQGDTATHQVGSTEGPKLGNTATQQLGGEGPGDTATHQVGSTEGPKLGDTATQRLGGTTESPSN
ncbi:MAG TPA: hypothetical protein V6D23_05265 [Candidatus Obscuribacterales bacterium]